MILRGAGRARRVAAGGRARRARRRTAGLRARSPSASATRRPTTGTTRSPSTGSRGTGATFVRGSRAARRPRRRRPAARPGRRRDATPARAVCVATGTAPAIPPIDGLADLPRGVDELVWTNREIVQTAGRARVDGRHRRRRDRLRAGAGLRPVRHDGHRRRGRAAPADARGAGGRRGRRRGVRARGHHRPAGRRRRSRSPRGGDGVVVTLADGSTATGREAARRRRPPAQPLRHRSGHGRPRPEGAQPRRRRAHGRRRASTACTRSATSPAAARSRTWRCGRRGCSTAHLLGEEEPYGGYHGLAWVDLHRSRGRPGRAHRAAGARQGAVGAGRRPADRRPTPAAGSTARATTASSRSSRTPTAACSSAPPSSRPTAARSSACSPSPCTPQVPVATLRTMHYAFPTLHRAVLEAMRRARLRSAWPSARVGRRLRRVLRRRVAARRAWAGRGRRCRAARAGRGSGGAARARSATARAGAPSRRAGSRSPRGSSPRRPAPRAR